MSSIGRLQQILAQIRSGLATKADGSRKTARTGPTGPSPSQRASAEEIRAQISRGLVVADLGTAEGRRSARRVFLESVLLAEFGLRIADDPRFEELVVGVQDSFEHDDALLTRLDEVIAEMRQA